jgi:hypothetical protein
MKRGWWVLKFAVFGIVALTVVAFGTQLLWNWLVPQLFNGPVITFAQTVGLLILSKIFLWTFGRHHGGGHWQGGRWRSHYWKQKWSAMTPEEREALKRKMKDSWCRREPGDSTTDPGTSNG